MKKSFQTVWVIEQKLKRDDRWVACDSTVFNSVARGRLKDLREGGRWPDYKFRMVLYTPKGKS